MSVSPDRHASAPNDELASRPLSRIVTEPKCACIVDSFCWTSPPVLWWSSCFGVRQDSQRVSQLVKQFCNSDGQQRNDDEGDQPRYYIALSVPLPSHAASRLAKRIYVNTYLRRVLLSGPILNSQSSGDIWVQAYRNLCVQCCMSRESKNLVPMLWLLAGLSAVLGILLMLFG